MHVVRSCFHDVTTLSNSVLEHAQSHQHTIMLKEWVWSVNHRHAEQKCTIYSTSKPFWAIWSTYKPVLYQYLLISCAYSTNRCLEREIWWFLCQWQWQRWWWQTDKLTALSLVHAHGVIKDSFMCTIIQQTSAPLLPPYSRHLPSWDIAKHKNNLSPSIALN